MARFDDIGGYSINLEQITFIAWDNAKDNPEPRATIHFTGGPDLVLEGENLRTLESKAETMFLEAEDVHARIAIDAWPDSKDGLGRHELVVKGVVGTYETD